MNKFKIYTLFVFIIIIAVLIFIIFRDSQKITSLENRKITDSLNLKAKCLEDGTKVHDQWIEQYSKETFLLDPIYTYNPQLNTCLWSQSYTGESAFKGIGDAGQIYDAFILDVYTNKIVIEYTTNNSNQLGDVTQEEFNEKYKKLFNTNKDFYFFTQ